MNKSTHSRSSLFLMEIIVAILFFALVSAVCLRIFTKSHQLGSDTQNLNMAVSQAASVAELLKSDPDLLSSQYPDAVIDGTGVYIYYDEGWELCAKDAGTYCLSVVQTSAAEDSVGADSAGAKSLVTYEIVVYNINVAEKHAKIYDLTVKVYTGRSAI